MTEAARKNFQTILQALALSGAKPVAEACGVDVSTVTRWKSNLENGKPGPWQQFANALAAMGLKVVPDDAVTVDREPFEAILLLAKMKIQETKGAEDLRFSEIDSSGRSSEHNAWCEMFLKQSERVRDL